MPIVDVPNDPGVLTAEDWRRQSPCVRHLNAATTLNDDTSATIRIARDWSYLQHSVWFEYVVQRLVSLAYLPPDWNGEGSLPVSRDVLSRSLVLLAAIAPADTPIPSIVPATDGGIQIDWHESGLDIEISLPANEDATYFAEDLQSGDVWEDVPVDPNDLRALVQRLTARQQRA